jgi:uncharacterized membrane protein YkoI
MSSRTRRGIAAAAVVAALGGGGAAIAIATGGGDDDDATERPIAGGALQKAKDAALDHTGGGSVTGTEVGDEESYYEVEVTRDDGSQVDVQLDRGFDVVGAEDDDDSKEEEDGDDE